MNPKKILLFLCLLLPLAASAGTPAKKVSKTKVTSVIAEARRYEGVEVVRLGRVATAALKGLVRAASREDPDAREALQLMRGVKNLTVLDYDDCAPAVRERLARRLDEALGGSELLMEAKESGGTSMQMFGILDEQTDLVRDFVIHAPSEGALICIFGSIPMDVLGKVTVND
jgi:hypothetical protein